MLLHASIQFTRFTSVAIPLMHTIVIEQSYTDEEIIIKTTNADAML